MNQILNLSNNLLKITIDFLKMFLDKLLEYLNPSNSFVIFTSQVLDVLIVKYQKTYYNTSHQAI